MVEDGAPVAAAIFNPMTEEMFAAVLGGGATLNGAPIHVSDRRELEGCRMLVARDVIEHPAWPTPWPTMEIGKRASIAYRMALVANGTYDAMMALSSKHEWDTAAGTLIVEEAGGVRQRAHGRGARLQSAGADASQPRVRGSGAACGDNGADGVDQAALT